MSVQELQAQIARLTRERDDLNQQVSQLQTVVADQSALISKLQSRLTLAGVGSIPNERPKSEVLEGKKRTESKYNSNPSSPGSTTSLNRISQVPLKKDDRQKSTDSMRPFSEQRSPLKPSKSLTITKSVTDCVRTPNYTIRVQSTLLKTSDKFKENVHVIIVITSGMSSYKIEKTYTDFVELERQVPFEHVD